MLFLGTKKYPEENAYLTYLNSHGGTYNGYTMSESTNYMFEIAADHLDGALDLFSQFFIEPSFTESGTSREVEAVNSEHSKNLQSDIWRIQRLNEVLASNEHPMSKFGTGTAQTLQSHADLRDQVVSFWKKNYSSNIMKLAVLGKESLDDLERSVREKFSAIENRHIEQAVWNGKPYGKGSLATRISAVPVAEMRRLSLAWPTKALRTFFRSKPESYLSHLVGHEGEGSILSVLKKLGWAEALVAGGRNQADHSLFQVSIELSREGLDHINEIVDIIYAYLALIKDHGVSQELAQELTVLGDLAFRFKDKEDPFTFVSSLASNMQIYPPEYVLNGSRISDQYNPELIQEVLAELNPENMLIGVYSPSFKKADSETPSEFTPNLIEEHYGIEYRIDKLSGTQLERWQKILKSQVSDLHSQFIGLEVPKPNPFMPDDLTLATPPIDKDAAAAPEILIDTPTVRFWHKQDQTFKRPRAMLMLEFRSPVAYYSPMAVVKTKMFIDYLVDELNEFGYDAQIAGLKYSVTTSMEGFSISISGYNCKQNVLLEQLLKRFKTLQIQEDRFELLRMRNLKSYQNIDFGAAYSLANYQLSLYMEQPRWYYRQYMTELAKLAPSCVQSWIPQLLNSLYVEIFAIGNIDANQAKKIADLVQSTFEPKPLLAGQFAQLRCVQLDPSVQHWIQYTATNPEEVNSAVINSYQIGPTTPRTGAVLELLNQIVMPLAFDTLRTKEQLGYIVATSSRSTLGVDSWLVIVQSAKADPVHLDQRIEAWIATVAEHLTSLPAEEFEQNRMALIMQKREKHTSLRKEASYYWDAISAPCSYDFELREKEAQVLEKITPQEIVDWWNTYHAPNAPKRSKISAQTWPASKTPSVPENIESTTTTTTTPINVISDPFLFKSRMPLHGVQPLGKERVTVAQYASSMASPSKQ
jgi:insulysin